MRVESMQFRDFVFQHNPKTIVVGGRAALASHLCPGRGEVVQNLGKRARTVRCEGSFLGNSYREAMSQVEEFRGKAEGGPGILMIPGVEPFPAQLESFVWEARGDGRIIAYSMAFLEDRGDLL